MNNLAAKTVQHVAGGVRDLSHAQILFRRCPLGRSLHSNHLRTRLICRLDAVRRYNRTYQARKALLQLRAPRHVLQLHAMPLAPNQAGLAKDLEVL